jgi:AbrB family looped-hinge helix DNA binding protein
LCYFAKNDKSIVSVTSKGQVTIPKRMRRALGITPGSKVEV